MKILIVEDNSDSRTLLAKQLRSYGHEVTAAANGAEALQQALKETPDMLVTDILMPEMDGYRLCHEWKQNDRLKDIPVVFYTATYTSDEDERFALSLGGSYICKPTEPAVLVDKLAEIFEKARTGASAPSETVPLAPSLFLTEYNKRVVAKLEDKMAQLEREITERKRAQEQLGDAFIDLAETVSRAMGSRDPYTSGHQRRVAELARVTGEKMRLEDDRLQGLYIGALLHDIGKISVPEAILVKPGKLSHEEWSLVRVHALRGYELLQFVHPFRGSRMGR